MSQFRPVVIEDASSVVGRLADFGLAVEQIAEIGRVATMQANDASPIMPLNAPGTLAYIFGVQELRQQLVNDEWLVDRTCGIEAVVNRRRRLRIAYQNVDRACDIIPPNPRSTKGSGSEDLCGPTLFEHFGVETGPLTGVRSDGITTYFVMVGDDGSVELSCPIISGGRYKAFAERIFITKPSSDDVAVVGDDEGPISDFEIEVSFKDAV